MTTENRSAAPRRPLHPPLVHIAIGGVVTAAICDVVSAAGSAHPWARDWFKGGSYALMIGTAVLFVTAIAGLADRAGATQRGSARRSLVNRHALAMSLVALACVTDLVLRNNVYSDAGSTPVGVLVLTLATLSGVIVGGELGGRLVYQHGIGVRYRDPAGPGAGVPAQARKPGSR
jgi:uncharacterized membrane protein